MTNSYIFQALPIWEQRLFVVLELSPWHLEQNLAHGRCRVVEHKWMSTVSKAMALSAFCWHCKRGDDSKSYCHRLDKAKVVPHIAKTQHFPRCLLTSLKNKAIHLVVHRLTLCSFSYCQTSKNGSEMWISGRYPKLLMSKNQWKSLP